MLELGAAAIHLEAKVYKEISDATAANIHCDPQDSAWWAVSEFTDRAASRMQGSVAATSGELDL